MPKRATLTTRSISSPSTASDQIPKNSGLIGSEIDSNFLELRDQSIGVVADDSSTIDVKAGDTLYIQGGDNVTTSTNSDGSVTINAAPPPSTGNFTFSGDDIQNDGSFTIESTATTAEISIISGTDGSDSNSRILLDTRHLFVGQNSTNVSIQAPLGGGDMTIANGGSSGSPGGFHNSIKLTDSADGEIVISPKTGKWVEIHGLRFPTADGSNGQALVTDGSGVLSFTTVSGSGGSINIDGGTAVSTYGGLTAIDGGTA